jgi:hypothetical protein
MAVISISIDEAKKLSKTDGRLNLDITSGLTVEIAECLIESKGGISLNSLTILTDDVAEILCKYPYSLQLGGPRLKASNQAIKSLSTHTGPDLQLQSIFEFNMIMATDLASHKGRLSISSFKDQGLTEEVLIELAKHQGDLSIINRFDLTPSALKAFLSHKGELTLPLINNMSADIAKKFKKHDGPVNLPFM